MPRGCGKKGGRASCAVNLPRPRLDWSGAGVGEVCEVVVGPGAVVGIRSATVAGSWLPAFLFDKKQLHPPLDGRLGPVAALAYTLGWREPAVGHPAVEATGGDSEPFANLLLAHEFHGDSIFSAGVRCRAWFYTGRWGGRYGAQAMEMSVQLRPEAVNQSGSREFPLFGHCCQWRRSN